jgi:hypothetical protein
MAVRGVPSAPEEKTPSYLAGMPPRRSSKKDTPAKLAKRMSRRWRVVLLRAKGEILGSVEAPDAQRAKAAAAVQFELDDVQRNRIMVQERQVRVTCLEGGSVPALSWQLLALPESRGTPKCPLPWSETRARKNACAGSAAGRVNALGRP